MNARDTLEWIIRVAAAVGGLATLTGLFHISVVKPLGRAFDRRVKQVTGLLETNNGKTIGKYIEEMAGDIKQVRSLAETNREQIEVLMKGGKP